jgi:hypothetical protein
MLWLIVALDLVFSRFDGPGWIRTSGLAIKVRLD